MTPRLLEILGPVRSATILVAVQQFNDSVTTYEPGTEIRGATPVYTRQLIAKGFAKLALSGESSGQKEGSPIVMKGASGLGDSMYMRPIVQHFLLHAKRPIEVMSDFRGVFSDLNVRITPLDRGRPYDIRAHYGRGKRVPGTNQWQDVCTAAGLAYSIPFTTQRALHGARGAEIVRAVQAAAGGRRVLLVHGGRLPMGPGQPLPFRPFQMQVLPDDNCFRQIIDEMSEHFLTVAVGEGPKLFEFECELDLWGRTTVEDLLDLGMICDAAMGQCSWIVPLAEMFCKPLLAVWSSRAAGSSHSFISSIKPEKVLSKPTSMHVMDNSSSTQITEAVRAFLDLR